MMVQPSIVFFGNERIATGLETDTPILRSLLDAGYRIERIVASNQEARSRKKRELEVESFAREHGITFVTPSTSDELLRICEDATSSIAVLAAYGRMVPQNVIDCFEHGIINIHPSLLPKHRGSIPIESVILQGEQQTGVSIMQLVRKMDAGPVYAQEHMDLKGNETKKQLAETLIEHGAAKLIELLPDIISGNVVPEEQDHADATYDGRITKEDGKIDWTKSAATIEREVRAYAGWPRSKTHIGGFDIAVTEAHVLQLDQYLEPGSLIIEQDAGCLAVACGDKTYLCIERLIPAGKKEMSIDAFLRGYGQRIKGNI